MSLQDDLRAAYNAQTIQDMKSAADPNMGPQLQYNPIDPETGLLKSQYQQQNGDQMTNALMNQQQAMQAGAQDQAAQSSQGALQNSMAALGMRGGASSSNRANLVRANMKNSIDASQNVANQGNQARLGLQVQGAQANQTANNNNIQQALSSIGGVNSFNLNKYGQNMGALSANNQAAATVAASKESGSWVCTEIHKKLPFTTGERYALLKLNVYARKAHKDLANKYLYEFNPLGKKIRGNTYFLNETKKSIKVAIKFVQLGLMEDAFNSYVATIRLISDIMWPEYKEILGETN